MICWQRSICLWGLQRPSWPLLAVQLPLPSKSLRPSLLAGRADYYGNLPNLAARVSALAQPGQVLLEGCQGFGDELQWIKEDSLALLQLGREGAPGGSSVGECIEISYLGQFLLKVGTGCTSCALSAQEVWTHVLLALTRWAGCVYLGSLFETS